MKLGLISDVHGNSDALASVLKSLWDEVDQILFLGDLCGYYPFVNECVDLWRDDRILGVRGNHDQVLVDCLNRGEMPSQAYHGKYGSALQRALPTLTAKSRELIQSLPLQREFTVESQSILMTHGAPWDQLEGRVYPDCAEWDRFDACPADVILLGHTHYPLVKIQGKKLIVNPGSVGQPRDRSGAACYAVLKLPSREVTQHRVPYDPNAVIRDAREHDPNMPYLETVLTR